MIKNYLATKTDLETKEEGLKAVWSPELNFIFNKKEFIASTVVVSYDSKYNYLWMPVRNKLGKYFLRKIPHSLSIPSKYHYAWYAGLWEKIEESLPSSIRKASRFVIPRIGGGLLTLFIGLQKSYRVKINPYTTRESYLATVIHEFGHIYWSQHKLWWYSNKEENLSYLQLASQLFLKKTTMTSQMPVNLPSSANLGELYAFCAEYSASHILWSDHQKILDGYIQNRLKSLTMLEKKKDLNQEDSVIEPNKSPHDFASVIGKIILTRYPKLWPKILTGRPSLIG